MLSSALYRLRLRHRAALLALASCSLFLIACAGDPPRGRGARMPGSATAHQQQQTRAEAMAASGYRPAESAAPSLAQQQWVLRGESVSVSLAYPGSGRALPLIVYLPGLGESSTSAGMEWREVWARAGYAVLGLQPLADDAQAWSSDLARAANFKALGRHHYDPALLPTRLQVLAAALAEARQRAAAGDPLWSRVDFTRLGLAGYELGAQTVLALPTPVLPFQALIALSPLASEGATAAGTSVPLLVIGSAVDSDPLGLFVPALAARALFENSTAGSGHALLWLRQASHAALAGSGFHESRAESSSRAEAGGRSAEPGRRRSKGGGGDGGGGKSRGGLGGGGPPAPAMQQGPAQGQAQTAAAIGVTSLAFFDARLRQRPEAQAWLDQHAEAWLQDLGEWRQR